MFCLKVTSCKVSKERIHGMFISSLKLPNVLVIRRGGSRISERGGGGGGGGVKNDRQRRGGARLLSARGYGGAL